MFIDPEAGKAIFRAEAEAWPSQRIGAHSSDATYNSARGFPAYPGRAAVCALLPARAGMPKIQRMLIVRGDGTGRPVA